MKKAFWLTGLLWVSEGIAAQQLSGVVVDSRGEPVTNASISLVGSRLSTQTDAQGRFALEALPEHVVELHIAAPGFSHRSIHLEGAAQDLHLVLQPTVMQQIDVFGLPIHASTMESVQPISVITAEELRSRSANTLGETLKREVGIHSSYYGPIASSPIIRGLEGPRVLIAQNGLDVGDVSSVGPDHLITTETASAEQIEILRGPATLFYGTGAIGGVINVVDDRVPKDNQTLAHFLTGHNTVNDEKQAGFGLTSGTGSFAYHLDGHWRRGEDYKIPGYADHSAEEPAETAGRGRLANSAARARSLNLGTSYLLDSGFIGIAYGHLSRDNGVPGHGHMEDHETDPVRSELQQNRWQMLSEIALDKGLLNGVNTKLGYTLYEHREIHPGEENTLFENTTWQGRVDLLHREFLWGWRGALSLEYKTRDFSSTGAEAFTPPSQTDTLALALVEENHFGNFLWQFGARIENVSVKADPLTQPMHAQEEEEEHGLGALIDFDKSDFTPYSLSAGFVWDFTDGYKFGISYTHAQRAPSAAELFALGPHIGTRTYEVGALFEIHEESPGEFHLDFAGVPKKEQSNNVDISLRKHQGSLGFVINGFYNEISDYYHQSATGLSTHQLFGHDDEDTHAHDQDLPVYIFQQADAVFYGVELELVWQPAEHLQWTLWGDVIQAELKSGDYLPRTPPKRLGAHWDFRHQAWEGKFGVSHHFRQDHIGRNETTTDAYTLVDAEISYSWETGGTRIFLFVQGENLTDEEARVHTSFLKDQAPRPGRGFRLGLRGSL